MEGEVSLVAGRSQREKRRSYKDLLREEEIIDAEVRKTSKKRLKTCSPQESDGFYTGAEFHKKKKKHDEDHSSGSHHKKKRPSELSLLSLPDTCRSPQSGMTAMGLLQAITSSTAVGSDVPYALSMPKERRTELRDSCRKPQVMRDALPVVGEEVELEGHYGGCHDVIADSSGSSSADSDGGKLMIHESSTHSKKKKKSKKSKKKRERERLREKKHSSKTAKRSAAANGSAEWSEYTTGHHSREEKKKKREEGGKHKSKEKKKKVLTAYQIFYKEYRNSILEEEPGLDFGDLSKRLADAWKQLPEGDKQVWRERSVYLQRKQMKSDAVKHVKHLKEQRTSQKVKDSSRVKGHYSSGVVTPAAGTVVLKHPETTVTPVQNGSAPLSVSMVTRSPIREPDVDPIDAAAHLQLLGESLSLIGRRLQETEGMVTVSGSLSVLLDSVLCALGPLACLTTQLPELNGCPHHVLSNTLDNIAYVMPGL
ncbi:HMG domain-containing protein 4-like isoform X1 [Xyrauchen texanus]|uniref:HMG domain-containing protein 4-like isoform X1 n=1 Tax=Xyrauchen texanus TaxID=154827 RepID=UPI002242C401|nr:HMG domain-containing protein 4-like isoform X1 [Xyrauchen texanus]